MNENVSLIRYEAARAALAEAVAVDEVLAVRGAGRQMKAYAKIAKDKKLQADAAAIIIRAERKLGVMIQSAKETGQLGIGRPAKSNVLSSNTGPDGEEDDTEENGSATEPFSRTTLAENGVDKKLSMRAQNWARLGEGEFEAKLQEVRDKIESTGAAVVNPQKDLSTADKKSRRQQREIDLAARQRALPDKQYGVIYADPEWRFEPYSRDSGLDRAADNHYPTSSLEEIKARPVGAIADKDCVLFLWATVPMLPQALAVLEAWGFAYKSHVVWHKKGATGTGYWFRNEHELLLVGARGNVPAPAPGTQWPSIISEAPGEHSAKPEAAYKLIEEYYPTLPRIELNARAARDGWDNWGNEAPEENTLRGESGTAREASGSSATESRKADGIAGLSAAEGTDPDEAAQHVVQPAPPVNSAGSNPRSIPRPTEGPADGGEVRPASPPNSSLAAAPEGAGTVASGGGATGQDASSAALPYAGVSSEALSSAQKNEIIRAGYAQNTPLDVLAELTGLKKDAVKQRARTMKLGSRDRQKEMASAYTREQRRRQREGARA